jgi:hypothetical protein
MVHQMRRYGAVFPALERIGVLEEVANIKKRVQAVLIELHIAG